MEDPREVDSEDTQDELSKILNEVRSSFSPPEGKPNREHRTRRLKSLSFGGGLMLVVYNALGSPDAVDGQLDLISLAAAILILSIATLQFASGRAGEGERRGTPRHMVALLLLACVLTAQAFGAL